MENPYWVTYIFSCDNTQWCLDVGRWEKKNCAWGFDSTPNGTSTSAFFKAKLES